MFYSRRIQMLVLQADISERITLSPSRKPSRISITLTEARPNDSDTRAAYTYTVGFQSKQLHGATGAADDGVSDVKDVLQALNLDGAVDLRSGD